ncbi:MAG: DMT family transporter [Myxococcota bacterium]
MTHVAWRIHLALVTVQLLFGSWPVFGKVALRAIPGPALIGVRTSLAALVFFLLRPETKASLDRRTHAGLALAGLLGVTINQLLFIEGLSRSGAVNSTVLATTIPVFTLLFSLVLGTERSTARKGVGMGLAFLGALVVTGVDRLTWGDELVTGNLLLLANSAAYALYLILARRLAARVAPLEMVPWVFFYGALFTLPVAIPSMLASSLPEPTALLTLNLVYIVLGATVGTYWLNAVALRDAPPSLVAVYIYLQPVVAALLALPVLGEVPSWRVLVGGLAIFAGVTLSTRRS